MKFLLYAWNANNEEVLAENLRKTGFEVVWFRKECKHYTRDMELAMEMIQCIHQQGIEAVISFNYFPIISMICNTCQLPYYAWVYDCPHFTLYAKQIALPCNHIGIFDREMVEHFKRYDVSTIYHVPLSVDTDYFMDVVNKASLQQRKKYGCDISFVGSLYTDEYNYYDRLTGVETTEEQGTDKDAFDCQGMNEVIQRQCFVYDKDYLQDAISQGTIDMHLLQKRMEKLGLMLGEDYFAQPADILKAAVLDKKVTIEERRRVLEAIAGRMELVTGEKEKGYDRGFCLYTGSDTSKLPLLQKYNCGRVDYRKQMPLVFAESKINLNISLRSIHSGIPLRVLDIMACGGFVLTNWQPELEEYFTDGQQMAVFHSLEECMEKAKYYLSHEEERRKIAEAGRETVRTQFCYERGLNRLLLSNA